MKFLIITLLVAITAVFASASTTKESKRLCKVFSEKAKVYKKEMRKDSYAQKTLESYEARAKIYCHK